MPMPCSLSFPHQVVDDEVGDLLAGDGVAADGGDGFKEGGEVAVRGQHGGIVGGDAEVFFKARGLLVWQFRDEGADLFQQRRGADRQEIGAGEVAVVVRVLLGAHHLGFPAVVIPAAGGLDLRDAAVEVFGLALDFKMNRATDGRDRVEVLEFYFGA